LQPAQPAADVRSTGHVNPFVAFRRYLAWNAYAGALSFTDASRETMITDLDQRVAAVAGTGFVVTPFARADRLSDALGFDADGGVWVKDETRNVAGSHKARHLFTILLHLTATELAGRAPWRSPPDRPPLAIASCGNAALAAATLAAAVEWPIRVFVPPWANAATVASLTSLGAQIVECPRRDADPPGDPCVHRFREAVGAGAVPFGVQGTENAWALDGGRTIGWEMARQIGGGGTDGAADRAGLDRLFVQVGGGGLATCSAAGLAASGEPARIHAVQTAACAPLERAWQRSFASCGPRAAAEHWAELMWPWEHVGASAADGILDDETYDWLPVLAAMADTDGSPIVVAEDAVVRAFDLAHEHTSIDVSATGTAGLAGLLAIRDQLDPTERVAVIFSGVNR
jgi:threonine synthase